MASASVKRETASPGARSYSVARFLCSSSASLLALQSLPEPCMIVLFTPSLPQLDEGYGSSSDNSRGSSKSKRAIQADTGDPFECFGLSLSRRHARIRHVPFIPKVGLTDKHLPWVRQAHGIIAVVCEPPGESEIDITKSISSQDGFLEAVATALHDMRPTDSNQVTLSEVYCGAGRAAQNPAYQNIIHCQSHRQTDLEDAARLLMGS